VERVALRRDAGPPVRGPGGRIETRPDALRERLRRRALRLVEFLPRTEEELRLRLSEKAWARPHPELVDEVVADCAKKGLLGGEGHEKALRDRLFGYAVNLLAHAARTERELRRRLARPVWSTPALVDDVVAALKRYGYVDDEDYARRYAERRAASGRSGARRLRLELRAKGVEDREVIDEAVREAFERAPEADAVDALIAKRTRGRPVTDPDEMRRLRDFLLRRGFDPDTVYERLRAVAKGIEEE
jgi:regulatory protein